MRQTFTTPPRTWRRDTEDGASDLARYSRLEHGTPDPTWTAKPRSSGAGNDGEGSLEGLRRWLRGDDAALEDRLGGTPTARGRRVRTTG